ncbi:cold shock domain-containing protein [Pedobacter psychrodurus]|uniref:Cold shock domain-containing protein n=1 Tax=Pedobacter psychrodurus TaxID=2530456 RepID=A0A4R0PGS1_9SPHI|nr:cold shock domain-containing protein [Pedobacter psychrodurus]TCD18112.1 cold shock domain-containing protein [Pedobacter psychrodurus]
MEQGKVKMYNGEKGFGFITPDANQEDVFVHVTGLLVRDLKAGDVVEYETEQGRKGLVAINVKKI